MNNKQVAYQFGRVFSKTYLFDPISSTGLALGTTKLIIDGNNITGIIVGTAALYMAYGSYISVMSQISLNHNRKIVEKEKKKYPIQHANEVEIDDPEGLESILNETAENHGYEWGTIHRTLEHNGKAIIHDIQRFGKLVELGYFGTFQRNQTNIDLQRIYTEGWTGVNHYHRSKGPSWFGGRNYSIHAGDRVGSESWMNLLSFNMPDGPEIIAYNWNSVFIPKNKTKKVLVRATPKDIMKYLSA